MENEKNTKVKKRHDLRKGESQHKNGTFQFRWTDAGGNRHSVYAPTLEELRIKEEIITKDKVDGIKTESRFITVNDLFALWKQLKKGLKDNTFQNYKYMYEMFVAPRFGKLKISTLVKSDVKRFYNYLADECGLAISTVDGIHNILHQI